MASSSSKDGSYYGQSYNPRPGVKTAKFVRRFLHGAKVLSTRAGPAKKRVINLSPGKGIKSALLGNKKKKEPVPWI